MYIKNVSLNYFLSNYPKNYEKMAKKYYEHLHAFSLLYNMVEKNDHLHICMPLTYYKTKAHIS